MVIEPMLAELAARFDPDTVNIKTPFGVGNAAVFQLVAAWREKAWRNAELLVSAPTPQLRAAVAQQIELAAAAEATTIVAGNSYLPPPTTTVPRDAFCASHNATRRQRHTRSACPAPTDPPNPPAPPPAPRPPPVEPAGGGVDRDPLPAVAQTIRAAARRQRRGQAGPAWLSPGRGRLTGRRSLAAGAASTRNFAQDNSSAGHAEIVTVFCIARGRPGQERRGAGAGGSAEGGFRIRHHGPSWCVGQLYLNADIPEELAYYPTVRPELRLVTSGGPLDGSTRHYRDNLVAFAVQA